MQNLAVGCLLMNGPSVRLFTTYLRGLSDLSDQLADDEAAALEDALVTILAMAVRGGQPSVVRDLRPLSVVLGQRVLGFSDRNINNPDLNLGFVLRHFNVSRAHLYCASRDGGVSSVIQGRRLDAAFLELTQIDLIH